MFNILKRQNKTFLKLNFMFACILLLSNIGEAKNIKRAGSSRNSNKKKTRPFENKKNTTSQISQNTISQQENNQISTNTDTSHITKYNCENLYNQCMNETCFNNKTGRCDCNTTSVFETANQKCEYITNAFPYLKDEIVNSYKRIAKSDCTSYTIQQNTNELNSSLSNVLAELTSCMQPKCRANRTDEFVNCFDKDNMEAKLQMCKNIYKDVKDKSLLFEMFEKSISTYKTKYCNEIFGTMRNNECYIKIGIGTTFKDIKKIQEFKIGDSIICSEKNFGTDFGESKHEKFRMKKDIVIAGIETAKVALDIVGSASSMKNATGADITITAIAGAGSIATPALNALPSIMMLKEGFDTSYSGYCYAIKGDQKVELFGATDDYSYQLRWAQDWSTKSSFIGEE